MTLKEGLRLIQPSPYGDPDAHLLVRLLKVEQQNPFYTAAFRVAFYNNSGELHTQSAYVGERVSLSTLRQWVDGRRELQQPEPPPPGEMDRNGYELHDVGSWLNRCVSLIETEKAKHDTTSNS